MFSKKLEDAPFFLKSVGGEGGEGRGEGEREGLRLSFFFGGREIN